MKPFWDDDGNLHASNAWITLRSHRRYEGYDGNVRPSTCAIIEDDPDTKEYVYAYSGGLAQPGSGTIGPDGNIYIPNYCPEDEVCLTEAKVFRYAGPLADGVSPGDPEDNRGDCIGIDEGCPCPSDLGLAFTGDPETAVYSPGGYDRLGEARFGPDGNLYVAELGNNEVLRFTGPTPAGDCAGLEPGDPCPNSLLGTPGTAEFLPPNHGVDNHRIDGPYDITFVWLPPAGPCVPYQRTSISEVSGA